MDCVRYGTLVEPALDPAIDPDFSPVEREAMQAHDRWCRRCRDRLEEHRRLFDFLEAMPREAAPHDLAERVLARLDAIASRRHRRQVLAAATLWAACGLGTALVLGGWVWNQASGVQLLDTLGRLATWWYSWLQDLAGSLLHLRATPVDMPPILLALARAARLVLEACADQLLAAWLVASVLALLLRAGTGARHLQLRSR